MAYKYLLFPILILSTGLFLSYHINKNKSNQSKPLTLAKAVTSPNWYQVAKLYSPNAQKEGHFGTAVAISGKHLIVGAYLEDKHKKDVGMAYIFKQKGEQWILQSTLSANDGEEGDELGYSVAISGDYAVVGASGRGFSVGAAYVFKRENDRWIQQAKLEANDGADFDFFGHSVTIFGDYIAIGAYGQDTGGENAGAVYIFNHKDGKWGQQAKLQANDKEAKDEFGWEVSISNTHVVVGAHLEDTGGQNAGAAYVFKRENDHWTQQAKLQANGISDNDHFGSSVAISNQTIIIGSPLANLSFLYDTYHSGATYVFKHQSGHWLQTAILKSNNKVSRMNEFGSSVAIKNHQIVIGIATDMSRGNMGATYAFQKTKEGWSTSEEITAKDKKNNNFFGSSVAISQDYVVVGADPESTKANGAGAIYIFKKHK